MVGRAIGYSGTEAKVLGGWLLASSLAGAAGALGFLEFNLGGPPYDGGFIGFYVLAGILFSSVQGPFIAVILSRFVVYPVAGLVWSTVIGVLIAAAWATAGALGWILTSFLFFPWLGTGIFQGVVLFCILVAFATTHSTPTNASEQVERGASRQGVGKALETALLWVLATLAGGVLLLPVMLLIGTFLSSSDGNAATGLFGQLREYEMENLILFVLPTGLAVMLLYGPLTGIVLIRAFRRSN